LFQVFQIHLSANLSRIYLFKHQIYSKYILNPNKLNISIKNIKLKQKFDLLSNVSLIQFYNILHQKINVYFQNTITSFFKFVTSIF